MIDISDLEIRSTDYVVEEVARRLRMSGTAVRKIMKESFKVAKESLKMGYGVRFTGFIDIHPDVKGQEKIYRSKISSTLERPITIRRLKDIEAFKPSVISDEELLGG